jgi:hypothetical protein
MGEGDMAHFTLEKWADFARNALKEKDKEEMQGHLDTGCKRCADALKLWMHVRDVTSREGAYQPLAETVRTAKAMFGIHASPRHKAPILDLLFDSALNPSMVGVRSTATAARQLLYAAGAYRIDLRMEPLVDTDRVSVLGQILNSADPTRMIEPLPITLVQKRKIVSSSRTGSFGEFQLECKLSDRLQLRLRLPDGVGVEIPLLEPSKAAFTGELESPDSRDISATRVSSKQSTRRKV